MKTARRIGVLFDKDGTLIDFEATWFPIAQAILRELRRRSGVSERVIRMLAAVSGIRRTGFARECLFQSETTSRISRLWAAVIAEHGKGIEADEINRIFTETAKAMAGAVSIVPGTRELLGRLKDSGCRLGVATSDNRASTEAGLASAGILDFFDFIAADGDGLPAKPEPDAALEFGARFGLQPRELSMVGDSRGDMLFAQRAGARFIGMKTTCNASETFSAAGYPVLRDFTDATLFERLIA